MFRLIKQVFIELLSFSGSSATKYMSFSNEPGYDRPTYFDLNPAELNYYAFMTNLDKCNGSYNVLGDLPTKIYVVRKSKDLSVKIFYMITKVYKAKTMRKHIACNLKCKFNRQHIIQIKNEIMKISMRVEKVSYQQKKLYYMYL